jgi:molecular chaperone HtpG
LVIKIDRRKETMAEKMQFQAETKQLLDLMINSIYTHKEIFLRELISNASDALDKARFRSLTDTSILADDTELKILLEIDKEAGCLKVSDNGIGMSYDEVIQNIGTIAKSGSKAFIEKMKQTQASADGLELIGQFGVGFYSAFMVAKKVTIMTKSIDSQERAVLWESEGDGTYTIDYCDRLNRGTTIVIDLRDEFKNDANGLNLLDQYTISELVKKYSDYIRYPIIMDYEVEEKIKDDADSGKEKTVTRKIPKTLNSLLPLWEKDKKNISQDEYNQLYKDLFHDWNDPIQVVHFKGEGTVQFTALVYIPSKAPYDFYTKDFQRGVSLYSKHVFIMEKYEDLLPEYLGFIKGLVDSPDFSLNISRELLQQGKQLQGIKKSLEKNIIQALKSMLENDRKKYEGFWKEFSRAIKAGIYMNYENKEKLSELLMFDSSSDVGLTTLKEYVSRMKEGQEYIYYAFAKDRSAAQKLPQIEGLIDKGFEVLFIYENMDELVLDFISEFNTKKIQSASKEEEKPSDKQDKTENAEQSDILQFIKEHLKNTVSDVRISSRLKNSPSCIVSSKDGISMAVEQLIKQMGENQDLSELKAKKILEINPDHKMYAAIKASFEQDKTSQKLKNLIDVIYAQALISQGLAPEDPSSFIEKISELIS